MYEIPSSASGRARYEFFVSVGDKTIGVFRTDDSASTKVVEGIARDYGSLNAPKGNFEVALRDNNLTIDERLRREFRSGAIKNVD